MTNTTFEPAERKRLRELGTKLIGWVVAIAAFVLVTCIWDLEWLIAPLAVVAALGIARVIAILYLVARLAAYRKYRKPLEESRESDLKIPKDVFHPKSFTEIKPIDRLQKHELTLTPDLQGQYRSKSIMIASLAPLALAALAAQVAFSLHPGKWAYGLILGEAALLLYLIFLVWTSRNPPMAWIISRVRAELLRREQYLRLAGVGPYISGSKLEDIQTARVTDISGCEELADFSRLVPLQTKLPNHQSRPWLAELWQRAGTLEPLPDLAGRMESYLWYRVRKQRVWFALGKEENERREWNAGLFLKGALLLAFIIAVVHAISLRPAHAASDKAQDSQATNDKGDSTNLAEQWLLFLALATPALGTVVISIQAIFNFRTLAEIYRKQHHSLRNAEKALQAQIDTLSNEPGGSALRAADVEFRSLVLDTEESITHELEQWLLLHTRLEFEAAP